MKRLSGQGRAVQKSILMVVQACPLKVIMVGKPNSVNVSERHLYLSDDFLYKEILLGAKTCHCNRRASLYTCEGEKTVTISGMTLHCYYAVQYVPSNTIPPFKCVQYC